ncbi:MAG: histidine phosphatase family protein [Clostridia bacterium]|nr:histidine phosphatase family protein [Clostridia bacterium]
MTRMIFIRHGQSMGNLEARFYGNWDGPLTDLGRAQAAKTAEYLRDWKIDAAYGSDLCRAYETGTIIAAPHNLAVTPDKGLREIFAGEWEDRPFEELPRLYSEDFDTWLHDLWHARPTGGESVRELAERVRTEVWRIASLHDGQTVLIATHATPIRTLICEWKGEPYEKIQQLGWVGNASVSVVDYDNERHRTQLVMLGEDSFLGDMATTLPKSV